MEYYHKKIRSVITLHQWISQENKVCYYSTSMESQENKVCYYSTSMEYYHKKIRSVITLHQWNNTRK